MLVRNNPNEESTIQPLEIELVNHKLTLSSIVVGWSGLRNLFTYIPKGYINKRLETIKRLMGKTLD